MCDAERTAMLARIQELLCLLAKARNQQNRALLSELIGRLESKLSQAKFNLRRQFAERRVARSPRPLSKQNVAGPTVMDSWRHQRDRSGDLPNA